jgi:hypothetical protein
MKRVSLLVLLGTAAFAQTAGVRTVYILPMAGGLDQYLAGWLTREHIMQVVTDPRAADAVFTDRLGARFHFRQITQSRSRADSEKAADEAGELGSRGSSTTQPLAVLQSRPLGLRS